MNYLRFSNAPGSTDHENTQCFCSDTLTLCEHPKLPGSCSNPFATVASAAIAARARNAPLKNCANIPTHCSTKSLLLLPGCANAAMLTAQSISSHPGKG